MTRDGWLLLHLHGAMVFRLENGHLVTALQRNWALMEASLAAVNVSKPYAPESMTETRGVPTCGCVSTLSKKAHWQFVCTVFLERP